MNAREFTFFVQAAVRQLTKLNKTCEQEFKVSTWPRWRCDLDHGTLTFLRDNAPKVRASIQAIGGVPSGSKSWVWAWANASLPKQVTEVAGKVRAFGEREKLAQLLEESIPADDYLGWEMTALAAKLTGATGAYRCKSALGLLYVTYTSIGFVPELVKETKEADFGADAIWSGRQG
ncbi:MAG TPA: hypothetical protein VHX36_03715 [Candidatus Acidoferrales bacterium]|jgi:hypothetical protein|nr:hypothetical protein [Candidatus Acidoferrales bacterium]